MANAAPTVERQVYHQAEVVALLGTSRASLLRMEKRGTLHPIRIHSRPLYLKREIDAILRLHQGEGQQT